MSLLKTVFGPSQEEIWKQFSKEIGGDYVDGGDWKGGKIIAKADHWIVTLDTYHQKTQHDSVKYTRLRAPYINPDNFRFTIYPKGMFTFIQKLFGLQDIEVGDKEFDDRFVIQSNNKVLIKSLFSNSRIRDLISAQSSFFLEVREDDGWFSEPFPEGVDELYCLIEEEITDISKLKMLFELFSEVLNHLCHLGAAYEKDPKLSLS